MNLEQSEESILLKQASEVAISNENSGEEEPLMRPSNAGYPLFQHVWRLLIEPTFPAFSSSDTDYNKRLKRIMSICSGHVFERAVEKQLLDTYPTHGLVKQQKLTFKHFTGSADFVLLDINSGSLVVVECKSVNKSTKREIVNEKLLVNNWGYKTQLSIYTEAAVEMCIRDNIRLTSIVPMWYVWSRTAEKLFIVDASKGQTKVDTVFYAEAAASTYEKLATIKQLFDNGELQQAAALAVAELPFDKDFINGYCRGCTPFHFSPFTEVFFDSEGYCKSASECQEILMGFLQIAKANTPEIYTQLAKEIING